jgi:hypothetical protein
MLYAARSARVNLGVMLLGLGKMNRRLSSILVPFYKLIFLSVLLLGLYWLFFNFNNGSKLGMLFLFLWCAVWYVSTFHWKSVYLTEDSLSVSNYLKRIEIPFTNIESVTASGWLGGRPSTIKLKLKSPSEFGESIVFVPRLAGFEASEIADELRQLMVSRR